MDFKTFLENFDAIAEAPGGIPKLRELILDLAMRGKLVPQNPDDEPASILLQKVQLNRKHLLERGKLNQKKPLKPIEKDEIPHGLPEGWNWCRFGQIIDCYRGHNPPKLEFVNEPREGYVRFIQITDFKTDGAAVYVPVSHNLKYVCKGEIAMAAYRHIGKLSRSVEGAFNVAICKVIELQPIYRDYIEKLIGSIYVKGELLAASGRAHIPSMHTEHLLSLVIPLPPLAEQKRIVEKVDELMGLCDRYEVRQANARQPAAKTEGKCDRLPHELRN
jgi:type I restriction enzyme S subunit